MPNGTISRAKFNSDVAGLMRLIEIIQRLAEWSLTTLSIQMPLMHLITIQTEDTGRHIKARQAAARRVIFAQA